MACLFVFFLVVTSILAPVIGKVISRPEAAIRIATVIQDLLVFIIPSLATAMLVSRLPARVLAIEELPELWPCMLVILVMICAVPGLNWVIIWNQNLHLPQSMAGVEETLRNLEAAAEATVNLMFQGAGVGNLIVGVLIVGVLAGLSEELFFRGALLRLIGMTRTNPHAAIWIVAAIFSFVHFQMFGFIPRLLLGAVFGYLLWWSQNLWLPVLAHVFNNTLVVIVQWDSLKGVTTPGIDLNTVGSDLTSASGITVFCLAIVLTAFWLLALKRYYAHQEKG